VRREGLPELLPQDELDAPRLSRQAMRLLQLRL
jgi:hypothetical protein